MGAQQSLGQYSELSMRKGQVVASCAAAEERRCEVGEIAEGKHTVRLPEDDISKEHQST